VSGGTDPTPPRSALALVLDRSFGPYFFGNLASNIGTWFQQITAAIVVFDLTGSTFMVGMVGVSQFLPSLLLAPWTGTAADRYDRRRLLLGAQAVAGMAAGSLAVVTAVVGLDRFPGAWPVLATAGLVGLMNAISTPAQNALVHALVPGPDLDQAIALNSVTFNLARAVGPALGAAVLVSWGAAVAFGVNAFSYAALVAGLAVIRIPPLPRPPRSSVWGGFRRLRDDPVLAMLLVGLAALGFGADPLITLTPALADELAGASSTNPDALVGILISFFGLGAVLGTAVVGRIRRRWRQVPVAVTGLGLLAGGLVTLALAPVTGVALAGMVVMGLGYLLAITTLTSAMHARVTEDLRGRVMALWGVAFLGTRPLAAFMNGAVADLVSVEASTLLAASAVAACGLALWRRVPADATGS
jgi:MFS family permease